MKRKKIERIQFAVSPGMYLYLALLVLLIPLQWLAALTVSVIVHEMGHILAMRLLKLPIYSISVYPARIQIHTQTMSDSQELICAAAGPLCGASLIALGKWLPALSLVAAFHCLYNLMPVYPTDGGRVLHGISRLLLPRRLADLLSATVQWLSLVLLLFLAGYGTFVMHLGLLPMIAGTAAFLWVLKEK